MEEKSMAEAIDRALSMAAWEGDTDTVAALVGAGADIHRQMDAPLWDAARGGHADTMRALLAEGASRNIALFEAAFYGITEIVRESLALGADVHMGDGIVVLMAAGNGHVESVRVLLAAGADVYSNDALLSAAREGHTETVRALLQAGAGGRNAAQREAAENGHAETAKVLKNWRVKRKPASGSKKV